MADDLTALEDWAANLLQQMQPTQRRRLTLDIARQLRRSQTANMRAQHGPDGEAWEPRKKSTGLRSARARIRQAAKASQPMFAKLRLARHIKAVGTGNEAVVMFAGRAARIARVHHFGETDDVKPGGPRYNYPARPLLGITNADRERLRDLLLEHLTRA